MPNMTGPASQHDKRCLKSVINIRAVADDATTDSHYQSLVTPHDFGERTFVSILHEPPQQVAVVQSRGKCDRCFQGAFIHRHL